MAMCILTTFDGSFKFHVFSKHHYPDLVFETKTQNNKKIISHFSTFYSDIFKTNKIVTSFQEILDNIFLPLFEATNEPDKHPELHRFLQYVIGFDSVDDESKPENPLFERDVSVPDQWTDEDNPPYAYYIYYMYANMTVLNAFRK